MPVEDVVLKPDEKYVAIDNAICYWLGYQEKIGRESLIHEASLRYPIADVITGQGVEINRVELEKGHPCFEGRRVDLVVYDKAAEKVDKDDKHELAKSIQEMYELKLAKAATATKYGPENQRVVDDILRLAYFHQHTGNTCFFVMCGTRDDFVGYFLGDKANLNENEDGRLAVGMSSYREGEGWNTNKSLYQDYFEFSVNGTKEYEFKIDAAFEELPHEEQKKEKERYFGLHAFKHQYKMEEGFSHVDAITVKTTCVSFPGYEKPGGFRTHACGIWKVEAV